MTLSKGIFRLRARAGFCVRRLWVEDRYQPGINGDERVLRIGAIASQHTLLLPSEHFLQQSTKPAKTSFWLAWADNQRITARDTASQEF